jgi:hypothetical protein
MIRVLAIRSTMVVAGLAIMAASPDAGAAQEPQITVRAGTFQAPQEKKADRAFRMAEGFRGPEHAKALGARLFERSGKRESIELKDDGAGNLQYVSRADPSAHFRINSKTGDFSFNRGMSDLLNSEATPNLPGREQAVELAKAHLRELGQLPDQEELVVRHVGGLRTTEQDGRGGTRIVDKLVTVHFGRQIDGLDVAGPGSKIVIDLGQNGELVGVAKRWIEVKEEKVSPAQFRSKGEVEREIRDHIQREWARARRATAEPPDLGYFDDGHGNIEPAYFFVTELVHESQEEDGRATESMGKYLGAVPAMKNSRARFQQEDRQSQPPRIPQARN